MTYPPHKIRLLYIVSQAVRWVAFEWLAGGIDRERFDVSFLLLHAGRPPLEPHLKARGVAVRHVPYAGRHAGALAAATAAVARHCRAHPTDIIHAHFMDACLAGLLGARLAGVPVRLHTRHHAGPYPRHFRPPWGAWYDRWNNQLSTAIVAPSAAARRTLVDHDGVPPSKVVVIPHGFDLGAFTGVEEATVRRLRAKYDLGDGGPVVGVVARYERIKGVEHIIPAFRRLLGDYPTARLVLANAWGRQAGHIRSLLQTLPQGRYTEIPFEEEMPALYGAFDVLVHVPIHPAFEGFGQVYVEAMAAGVPCVCTLAGIASEFVADGVNAVVVEPVEVIFAAGEAGEVVVDDVIVALAQDDEELPAVLAQQVRPVVGEGQRVGAFLLPGADGQPVDEARPRRKPPGELRVTYPDVEEVHPAQIQALEVVLDPPLVEGGLHIRIVDIPQELLRQAGILEGAADVPAGPEVGTGALVHAKSSCPDPRPGTPRQAQPSTAAIHPPRVQSWASTWCMPPRFHPLGSGPRTGAGPAGSSR